jgi:hypothetical protein
MISVPLLNSGHSTRQKLTAEEEQNQPQRHSEAEPQTNPLTTVQPSRNQKLNADERWFELIVADGCQSGASRTTENSPPFQRRER